MSVTSVERAFRILRIVGDEPRTLSEVADAVGMPLSTASRFLGSLHGTGALARDADGVYRIGPAISELAGREHTDPDLLGLAQPHLAALANLSGETSGIAAALDDSILHLGQTNLDLDSDVIVRDWTGFQAPMHSGCTGFVIMAWWPDARIDRYLAQPLEAFSADTMTDSSDIRERLRTIRDRGALWTTDEYAQGVTSVAAAIRDHTGAPVGSLHVHGPSYRFPDTQMTNQLETELLQNAGRMSAALGWTPESIGA
jgi:DNA-binding IclR family transcriptional regulator